MKDETRNIFYVRAIVSQLPATAAVYLFVCVRVTAADNSPPVIYHCQSPAGATTIPWQLILMGTTLHYAWQICNKLYNMCVIHLRC